jgi:hypothetical protein
MRGKWFQVSGVVLWVAQTSRETLMPAGLFIEHASQIHTLFLFAPPICRGTN